ncbi:hypothetical protein Tco_1169829, partial [Tanacetum coccineum]
MFMHTARDDSVLGTMRKSQKKSDSAISSEEYPSKKKSAKVKKVATAKPKPTKNKASIKANRGNDPNVLSEVALSKAAQLKEATKRSKKDFHISQASSSGDGTDFELGVPDEQHLKTTSVDEGTGTIPGVPNVPKYDSESEKGSWGDIVEEHDDDENDSEDKSDDEKEEKIDDEETMDKEEEDDEVTKELYDDVNANLGNEDTNTTNVDQGGSSQQNVSQESRFEQVEEDAHVTLTLVLETQKTGEPVQSSSVSSDFTSKLLNLENPSPANNEIASLMDTIARHATTVPKITSNFTTTIPPPPPFFNPLPQQATPTPTPT